MCKCYWNLCHVIIFFILTLYVFYMYLYTQTFSIWWYVRRAEHEIHQWQRCHFPQEPEGYVQSYIWHQQEAKEESQESTANQRAGIDAAFHTEHQTWAEGVLCPVPGELLQSTYVCRQGTEAVFLVAVLKLFWPSNDGTLLRVCLWILYISYELVLHVRLFGNVNVNLRLVVLKRIVRDY